MGICFFFLGRRRQESKQISVLIFHFLRDWLYPTLIEQTDICPANTFVPTIFRHTLIYAASRKLAATLRGQCSGVKAKYIEKSLHSLSFSGQISACSLGCISAKQSKISPLLSKN